MQHLFTNRLINESSIYLQQHAHNPVDWFAWGKEALDKAKKEDKIILISIGYSACHWCHVMERESFENEEVAKLMNTHFINIKIDREERPDLDHIYMDAVQAIAGNGGWPLNVFLTPDAKPFYGGTYYPPVKAFNRSSWSDVLVAIAASWKDKRNEILSQADNLTAYVQQLNNFNAGLSFEDKPAFLMTECDAIFSAIIAKADTQWGGFGTAPKFPQTFIIQYLFAYQHFTGSKQALDHALLSIDKILDGGIYDHIGGGMARYSTDNEWLVPHFEKMLYDNALLIEILCEAWQITKQEKYELAILKTVEFVRDWLTSTEGGFYSALDADTDGKEGKFYVWKKNEVESILKEDATLFCDFFDITEIGNWEGSNILRTLKSSKVFLDEKGLDKEDFNRIISNGIQRLSAERSKRTKPTLDNKITLGGNALMLKAISKAAIVLQNEECLAIALKNIYFIESNFVTSPTIFEMVHSIKQISIATNAFLDDYACLIAAYLQLYELTLDFDHLKKAKTYTELVIKNFSDEENVFFYYTDVHQTDVIIRKKDMYDGATPSGNSLMAQNLAILSIIYDIPLWELRSGKMCNILLETITKYPSSFGIWASLLLKKIKGMNEIAIVGMNCSAVSKMILQEYIPNKVLLSSETHNEYFPLLQNKKAGSNTNIYLCSNYTCLQPVQTTNDFFQLLRSQNKERTIKYNN